MEQLLSRPAQRDVLARQRMSTESLGERLVRWSHERVELEVERVVVFCVFIFLVVGRGHWLDHSERVASRATGATT
jgi:hypothetical protein